MARELLKWRVPADGNAHEVELPWGAKVIAVGAQTPHFVELWTESLLGEPKRVRRQFRIYPTGGQVNAEVYRHVGTAFYDGGKLVWHLYEYHADEIESIQAIAAGGLVSQAEAEAALAELSAR